MTDALIIDDNRETADALQQMMDRVGRSIACGVWRQSGHFCIEQSDAAPGPAGHQHARRGWYRDPGVPAARTAADLLCL